MLSQKVLKQIEIMQVNELTEYHVYTAVAKRMKDDNNKAILIKIANDEKVHSETWKKYTNKDPKPNQFKIAWYNILNIVFGFTFTLKIMEKGEFKAAITYGELSKEAPEALKIAKEEEEHEDALILLLDEERLQYVGSMVLGLNDALVELTGTLAGLSLALKDTKLIALSGLVTGISATLSMMSSSYLSGRSDGVAHPLKAASYTGIMYIIAVILLALPYLLFAKADYLLALGVMLVVVISIIFVFTYYVSVAKNLPFKKRFIEMATISMSVAAIAFVIGLLVKQFLGISI
ncbi:MAG: VIT1/CCC1 family protein [Erysipelotrichaceae bacterium]